MHEYIRSAPARGLRPTEVLSLLFHLGFCRPGHGYPMAALTPKERTLLLDFAAFGLVYIPGLDAAPAAAASASAPAPEGPQLFYPTSLSTLLTQPPDREAEGRGGGAAAAAAPGASDAGPAPPPRPVSAALASAAQAVQAASAADAQQLRLVVETNFRVYAFTSSLLHIGLLGLFARVDTRLPNLTTATLTRRSVVQANAYGIPAARIAAFLASHSAQPRGSAAAAAAARPALPKNVEEQLLLWELEKRRVSATRAVAIGPCASAGESERLRDIARALGGLLWEGRVGKDAGRTVVVSSACVAELRELARARGLEVEGGQGAGRRGAGSSSSSSGGGGEGGASKRARGGWAAEGEEEAEAGAEAEEEEEEEEILQVPD
jgi:transcription initiation factor TFIIH subunit 4